MDNPNAPFDPAPFAVARLARSLNLIPPAVPTEDDDAPIGRWAGSEHEDG